MTAWSLAPTDITKPSFFTLDRLYHTFTADFFSCCLWVCGLFYLQFCLKKVKSMLKWVETRWLIWPLKITPFLCLEKLLCCFSNMLWDIIHLLCEALSCISFAAFGWIWADSIAVASSINMSEPVPLAAIHAHAMTLPAPYLTDDVLWIMKLFICPKNLVHNCYQMQSQDLEWTSDLLST